ncbi:MAG: hypothetical protein M3Q75_05105 [Gemmatimonadota bacterium]|nr:hypothetical protein [Gemmatimonadota bacterium]
MSTKRETTLPVRGGFLEPWEVVELEELAAIRQHVAAFDLRTQMVATEWQREQKRERRRKERDRRRSRTVAC